jgi:hypothetical protein
MSATEALQLCAQMPSIVRKAGLRFGSGWSVRIYSPYSSDNTIAVCRL